MQGINGADAPGSALDVIDVHESSPIDAYLESSRRTRERIIDELRDLRDSEQALTDELTRQAGEARARCQNYQRALDALGARKPQRTSKPAAKRASRAVPTQGLGGANNWQISDEKVEEIRARLVEVLPDSPHKAGEVRAITAGFLAEKTDGLSPETARRGLNVLRDREVVRVAGTGKGGGVLFALMPEGASVD